MSRFNFTSGGAAAVEALKQELSEREVRRRQALMDSIMVRREDRTDEVQRESIKSLVDQRAMINEQREQGMQIANAKMLTPGQRLNPEQAGQIPGILINRNQEVAPEGDAETGGTMDVVDTFRGMPDQLKAQTDLKRKQDYLATLKPGSEEYKALAYEINTGNNAPAFLGDDTANRRTIAVGSFEDFLRQKHGERPTSEQIIKAREEYAQSGREGATAGERPYFLPQTLYDKQGRAVGSGSFDSRTGKLSQIQSPIEDTTMKPPNSELGKQSIMFEASMDALDNLKDMFDKGASEVIGPVEGRARAIGQNVPGVPVNKTFSDFAAATAGVKNTVIKSITGAAMGVQEGERIMKEIPLETDKPEVWLSKYHQSMANLARIERRMRNDRSTDAPAPTATPTAGAVVQWEKGPDGKPRRKK